MSKMQEMQAQIDNLAAENAALRTTTTTKPFAVNHRAYIGGPKSRKKGQGIAGFVMQGNFFPDVYLTPGVMGQLIGWLKADPNAAVERFETLLAEHPKVLADVQAKAATAVVR